MHLMQSGERLQVYVRKDAVPEADYALYEGFDLGDIVGVDGYLFRTRTGELSRARREAHVSLQDPAGIARKVARPGRRRDPLPPALSGSDRESGIAEDFRHAREDHFFAAAAARTARLRGSGNAHDAAALRRRDGASVRDASQHAGHGSVSAHRARTVPEAVDCRRPGARLRNQSQFPQRRDLHAAQPRVHHARVLSGLHRLPGPDGFHRASC